MPESVKLWDEHRFEVDLAHAHLKRDRGLPRRPIVDRGVDAPVENRPARRRRALRADVLEQDGERTGT
jgi:hypothetical protein